MKKTIIAIAIAIIPLAASAQWERINVGVDYAWQQTPLQFNGGVLYGRPDRAAHLNVNYRLWQHWEMGFYIGLQGAGLHTGGNTTYYTPQGDSYEIIYLRGNLEWGWTNGVLVQYHILPFNNRKDQRIDATLRLGFTPGGMEIDNVWAGIGILYRMTNNTWLQMNADLGTFRSGRLINYILGDDAIPGRVSVGVQVEL